MSKAFDICQEAVDKFGIAEANAYFLYTLRKTADILGASELEINMWQKIRALAKIKNSFAIFIIANEDAVANSCVVARKHEQLSPVFREAVDIVIKNLGTMPTRAGRGINARLSISLLVLLCCIMDIEREIISSLPSRKNKLEREQWDDLLRIKRSLTHYANFERI